MTIQRFVAGSLQTNAYLLTDEKTKQAALIDAPMDQCLIDMAAKLPRLDYILLTHGHFDHAMGAEEIRRCTGAKIAIHQLDAEQLSNPDNRLARMFGQVGATPTSPDVILEEGSQRTLGSLTIRVMHMPGHTPGGVCFLCEQTLFVGDTLFADGAGRTDLPGGDDAQLAKSLQRLCVLEGDWRVLPGHGPETTLARERRNNPYLCGNWPQV